MFLYVLLSVCLPVFLITVKSNEHIFMNIFMWIGPDQRKKSSNFGKDPEYMLDTKNPKFSKVPFLMYFQ